MTLAAASMVLLLGASPALMAQNAQDDDTEASQKALESIPWLTPQTLQQLRARTYGQQNAMDQVTNPAPAIAGQRMITISPMTPGPVNEIDTIEGYPTTISFIDITGKPWPLHWDMHSGDYESPDTKGGAQTARNTGNNQQDHTYENEAVDVSSVTVGHGFHYSVPTQGREGNTITITTLTPSPRGGLSVMLEAAGSPIPFQLRAAGPAGGAYDARVTVRILARGPEAAAALAVHDDDTPITGGSSMMDMLEGHPPAQAFPLEVRGLSPDRIRAWKMGKYYYLRTDVTVLSPQPLSSANGDHVAIYQITPASPVLISVDGHTSSIELDEK